MNTTYRYADEDDLDRISDLMAEQGDYHTALYSRYRRSPSKDEIFNYLKRTYLDIDGNMILCLLLDSDIIGFCACSVYIERYPWSDDFNKKKLFIDELFIDEEYRNYGIGTEFMNNIKNEFEDCNDIELMCAMNNFSGLKYYRKNGFSPIRERYLMRMEL